MDFARERRFFVYPLPLREISDAVMVYLTRLEHFNAAHKLYNPDWSREKNDEVFGMCANDNWHGHNFDLYITIKGEPNKDTGFLMDVKKLSKVIKEHVIEKLDHRNLNMDVDFLKGKMCSTENLAVGIWKELEPHLPADVRLHCVKLYETPRIYVEYFGA
jgi:6-pyruvoyltetrahydropterin/6-carboxytetrahydropterin synthase